MLDELSTLLYCTDHTRLLKVFYWLLI